MSLNFSLRSLEKKPTSLSTERTVCRTRDINPHTMFYRIGFCVIIFLTLPFTGIALCETRLEGPGSLYRPQAGSNGGVRRRDQTVPTWRARLAVVCVCLRADVTCVTVRWPQRVWVVTHKHFMESGQKREKKTDLVSFQQHNLWLNKNTNTYLTRCVQ